MDYLHVLILTEAPFRIATGTIALQVGDVNDNCPSLVNNIEYACAGTEVINVTALDVDGDPNSAPLSFEFDAGESQRNWRIEPLNGMILLIY